MRQQAMIPPIMEGLSAYTVVKSPSLDHLLESLGQGPSSCCHLHGVREQRLPFTGSHAGDEEDGKKGQNGNSALQTEFWSDSCKL